MIDPVLQGTLAESASSSTKVTGTESGMGQDAFLKMFMAQVTHQNPLDPMDNTEFTAQLATFSQLEQLTKIAKSMEGMEDLKDAVNQGTMVSYLGKEVTLAGDILPVSEGHIGAVGYTLESNAQVYAVITDETGAQVAEVSLGYRNAGPQQFQWDGYTDTGAQAPDGAYKVTIRAVTSAGDPVQVSGQTVTGLVTGYQKGDDGNFYLLLGEAALPLSDVLAVREPAGSAEYTSSARQSSEGETDLGDVLKKVLSVAGLAAALL